MCIYINSSANLYRVYVWYNHNVLFYHYSQPCPIVITDINNTPPVDNYTVTIVGLLSVDVPTDTCVYNTSVNEDNIYTVEMSVNNVIGSTKTTAGKFITTMCHCSTICILSLLNQLPVGLEI